MSLRELIDRFQNGDRRALARLISHLDDGGDPGEVFDALPAPATGALKVALTGSAGVGKSTLIAALVRHLRQAGKKVAVLMCDPASPKTGGALLGDRVRIEDDPDDQDLFIRSVSTRGAPGGISESAGSIAQLFERFGFEVILIETIGVGQDQVAAHGVADRFVLVLTPQTGDEVQWQKAGIMECADVIAVNKADLGGADSIARTLRQVTQLPVQPISATNDEHIDELWSLVESNATQTKKRRERT